jgi:hypothetical protein
VKNDILESVNMSSPSHSIETIQTSVPEPEIEKLLNGDDLPTSPEATVNELENLNKENEVEASAPAEENIAEKPEESEMPPTKTEDELVVEDVKDE